MPAQARVEGLPEIPVADHLVVIDLDRTALHTGTAAIRYAEACEKSGIMTADEIEAARLHAEADGDSFSLYRYVADRITDLGSAEPHQQLGLLAAAALFVDQAPNDRDYPYLLYPDTHDLIRECYRDMSILPLFLTTGEKTWQALKLKASRLERFPHMITTRGDKGAIVQEMFDETTGEYTLPDSIVNPPQIAGRVALRKVTIIDDKPTSFRGMTYDADNGRTGILVRRPGGLLKSQQGEVPTGVVEVASLSDIVLSESSRL